MRIVRARYAIELPCRFQLVAAANPCPCGRGPRSGDCTCDPAAVRAYEAKLTGALADRIDISLAVEQPDLARSREPGEGVGRGPRPGARRARAPAARAAATAGRTRSSTPGGDASSAPRCERLLADGGPERRASAAAGASGCSGSRARSPTSTAAERIAAEHVDEALCAAPPRPVSRRARPWTLEPGAPRLPGVRCPTSGPASARACTGSATASLIASARRAPGGDDRRLAQRRAPTGCGSPSGSAAISALAGIAVVSGMARGIDAAAHRGALDGGGGDDRRPRRRAGRRLPGQQRSPATSGSCAAGR